MNLSGSRPRWGCWLCVCVFGIFGCGSPTPPDEAVVVEPPSVVTSVMGHAAEVIAEADIERHVRELSDDRFAGREPGSEGDRLAQDYLVQQLDALGLEPGGLAGSWLQEFDLVGLTTTAPAQWRFTSPSGETLAFKHSTDFIVGSGVQAEEASVTDAELVFVGYGIQAPEYDWDDFKGVDVSGKILVMLNNDPHWDDALFAGEARQYYGRWTYKYEQAAKLGAAGAIIIHTDYSAGYPWQVVQTSWSGAQYELPNVGEAVVQIKAWMTEAAAEVLVASRGHELAGLIEAAKNRTFAPIPLGLKTSVSLPVSISRKSTANVLGLLPGEDPDLRDEVLIYSAHHDHLGTGTNDAGETVIYNGAMDNATGVANVLAIAKAFSSLSELPRRSVLFAFVGAEEQGLLGSAYYASNPTFPPGKISANINLDGGQVAGRSSTVSYIGFGRSTIDETALDVAMHQGRTIVGDQTPSAGIFYRSDHFSFARIGVPSLFYRGGENLLDGGLEAGRAHRADYYAKHYHQPSDVVTDAWKFDGLAEDARFGFFVGVLLANDDQAPQWYPGDEFEAARLAALNALR